MKNDPYERYLNNRFTVGGYAAFVTACFIMIVVMMVWLLSSGCTVTPHPVLSHSPSLDGTNRNSGLLWFTVTGDCVLTESAKLRYDSLVRRYGSSFPVTIKEGDGLRQANGLWVLDPEHCAKFETMTRWSR